MDYSNIEQVLFEHAQATKVRAPKPARRVAIGRVASSASVGAVALCSLMIVVGSGRSMKGQLLESPGAGVSSQTEPSSSGDDRGATIERKEPTRLADLLV